LDLVRAAPPRFPWRRPTGALITPVDFDRQDRYGYGAVARWHGQHQGDLRQGWTIWEDPPRALSTELGADPEIDQ
jgi:hypothetical protein